MLRAVVIIAHGFRGSKENGGKIYGFADRLNDIGLGAVAFDFSGSGESEGDFKNVTISRQAADLQHVIDFADHNYEVPLIVLGRSLGGSTVLAGAAADERIAGYIFWSAPVLLHDTFSAVLGEAYRELLSGRTVELEDEWGRFFLAPDLIQDFNHHDMLACIRHLGVRPVLVVHGQNDEVVSTENAFLIAEGAPNASLHIIKGADHRFAGKVEQRQDITLKWLLENIIERR
ncbi:alpha/beta hydrolase [Syntrophomonas palmitatica]|uniref:alpha/beta hydrolase n=1 Tax=Syntrophomonas palmitatica TaxID=402877 RepID=UPI00155DA60D|nr:alpha/beta fold hydrolase [Syntrophomonas palmitatica]